MCAFAESTCQDEEDEHHPTATPTDQSSLMYTYRHGGIDSLDVGFVHQYFSGPQTQCLDLPLSQILAALQSFNLFVETGRNQPVIGRRSQGRGGHVGRPLMWWSGINGVNVVVVVVGIPRLRMICRNHW